MKASQSIICKKCPRCSENYPGDSFEAHCPKDGSSLQTIFSDPWIGATLANRYNIVDLAGSGGWSTVYMAEQISLKRRVAVKILDRKLLSNENLVKRFEREAHALSTLQHPSIVSIIDFGVVPSPYIVMEWLAGEDLNSFQLARKAPGDLVKLFRDICDALQHAHSANIVHRDLKPSNIRVVFDNRNEPRAKILDFGLASMMQSIDGAITKTGETCGSPPYMSPEQCLGRPVTAASDIYSFGCVMYEALAGTPAFTKHTVEEYLVAHVSEHPAPIFLKPTAEERALEAVVQKCLAKPLEQRYSSASELLNALSQLDKASAAPPLHVIPKSNLLLAALVCLGCVGSGAMLFDKPQSPPQMTTLAPVRKADQPNVSKSSLQTGQTKLIPRPRSEFKSALPNAKSSVATVARAGGVTAVASAKGPKPPGRMPVVVSASVPSIAKTGSGITPEAQSKSVLNATPKPVVPGTTGGVQQRGNYTVTGMTWNDEATGRNLGVHIYQPKAPSEKKRPLLLYVPENLSDVESDWFLRRWVNSGFCVIVYDQANHGGAIPQDLRSKLELDRQIAQDVVFIVAKAKKVSRDQAELFNSPTTDFILCGVRNSAPALLAACGAKPDGRFWSSLKSVDHPLGLVLFSPTPFGSARCEVYTKLTVPVFVVCTAEDTHRLYWDATLRSSPAFSRALSPNRFQVLFPDLRFDELMLNPSDTRDRDNVADLSISFIRSNCGSVPSLRYLRSGDPARQLGASASYTYNEAMETDYQ